MRIGFEARIRIAEFASGVFDAQLRAAASLSEEDEFVNVAAAKEIADRLDGRVVIAAEVEATVKLGKINNVIVNP